MFKIKSYVVGRRGPLDPRHGVMVTVAARDARIARGFFYSMQMAVPYKMVQQLPPIGHVTFYMRRHLHTPTA